MADITELLSRLAEGDGEAKESLVPLVYQQLRQIAQRQLGERDAIQWDATELVHEAYLRMAGDQPVSATNRNHFYAIAANVIRRLLVDHSRRIKSKKRGGQNRVGKEVNPEILEQSDGSFDLRELDDALEKLSQLNQRQAKLVELRFFGGLTESEAAEILGVSRRTAAGDWVMAKAWLFRELSD